jgi:hypothetical protein
VKNLRWSPDKNQWLKRTRGAFFDEVIQGDFVGVVKHPKRPQQKIMLFELRGYIWVVPCVESEEEIFLKTAYPSRDYTARHRKGYDFNEA